LLLLRLALFKLIVPGFSGGVVTLPVGAASCRDGILAESHSHREDKTSIQCRVALNNKSGQREGLLFLDC